MVPIYASVSDLREAESRSFDAGSSTNLSTDNVLRKTLTSTAISAFGVKVNKVVSLGLLAPRVPNPAALCPS